MDIEPPTFTLTLRFTIILTRSVLIPGGGEERTDYYKNKIAENINSPPGEILC